MSVLTWPVPAHRGLRLKQALGKGQQYTNVHALPDLLPLRGYPPFDAFVAPQK